MQTSGDKLVVQALALIRAEYADRVTLDVLARKLGSSPAHLSRLFRQRLGTTVREYLTEIRMEHAMEQIRQGVKIEAVALSVGYRSKKNFYRQFKQRFGVTPDECR